MDKDTETLKTGELFDEAFLFKEITWKIPKDKILPNIADQDVQSPLFSFAGATWILHIYPYGRKSSNSVGWLELVIDRLDSNILQHVSYKFNFQTHRRKEFNPFYATYTFNVKCKGGWLLYMKKDNFLLNEKIVTSNGIITLVCQMRTQKINGIGKFSQTEFSGIEKFSQTELVVSFAESIKEKSKEVSELSASAINDCDCKLRQSLPTPGKKMLQDFKELYLKQEDCDVTLNVKGQEFPAHKNILKVRSSVFASTFRNNMKEKATGIVNIKDCDPSSFPDFLHFLYCGIVENLSTENVFSLFTTADKYDVQDLRSECLDFMKKNMSVDTFCDTIVLALQYSEKELIELTTHFFMKNLEEIIVTTKWQSFLVENPIPSNELLIKALVSKKNRNM